MTVSSNYADRLTIDQIVKDAYHECGVVDLDAPNTDPGMQAKLSFGRRKLKRIVDKMPAKGMQSRFIVFHDVTLISGTYTYDLSEEYLTVVGDGQYISADDDPAAAQSETAVVQVSMDGWHSIGSKASTGRPTMVYPHRGGTTSIVTLYLWPTPDEAGTIRFRLQRRPRSSLLGSDTPDLDEHWVSYLIWKLAAQIGPSQSVSLERCTMFEQMARAELEENVAFDSPTVGHQAMIDHRGPWG